MVLLAVFPFQGCLDIVLVFRIKLVRLLLTEVRRKDHYNCENSYRIHEIQ